ncbi:hypothetical protein P3T36_002242 [Kitasatospora sp. MAP12-15]|uniref:hypothetical protein n=1 Tax=unclassified Kitasatospora TaxID=2633591 RepID=UPI002475B119|nr:hypothetical protein [Kitasatospora sp. MAP12-44]MDH6108878.1 hypothetical protein [Kitasatospora sp. MAP12-44]
MTTPQQPPTPAEPNPDRTFRLGRVPDVTVALPDPDDSATLLDDTAWPTPAIPVITVSLAKRAPDEAPAAADTIVLPAAPTELPNEPDVAAEVPVEEPGEHTMPHPAPDELRRFGPGVPALAVPVPALAAAVWHGDATLADGSDAAPAPTARRRRRALGGWLLPAAVLLAVLAFLAWQRYAPAVQVTGVAVHTDPAGPGCNGTAVVTGTLQTDGGTGTVRYRWERSDGTLSDDLSQPIAKGSKHTDVVLRWTFDGHGSMRATATLDVLSPQSLSAATTFTYTCQ